MKRVIKIHNRLSFRLVFRVGLVLFVGIFIWAYFNMTYYKKRAIENKAGESERVDREIVAYGKAVAGLGLLLFLGTSGVIGLFIVRFVNLPIKKLIEETRRIGQGEGGYKIALDREDEIGQLALALNRMNEKLGEKQNELNKQKKEYQDIFELVPCYITIQDRNFRLLRYNHEFINQFDPQPGDYCFQAYKGRTEPCEICPVVKTFEDGRSHYSEEEGVNKDGTKSFWVVRTSPVRNERGEITAAMEMSLDLTQKRFLEKELKKTEEKYRTIFHSIPNPVFVLDKETLKIFDCNESAVALYGFSKEELLHASFLDLCEKKEQKDYAARLGTGNVINRARQVRKDGQPLFTTIRISASEYRGRAVFLVTTSDITLRLMAEQQLIQAGKMTTLGEMGTGVAHELNQPLSVIKTASHYLKQKAVKKEIIPEEILQTMTEEIDRHVDRASKIINHMREFGRKSDVTGQKVQVNAVIQNALDFFSQQLKLRSIDVALELARYLPDITADANRLEQVFINLLINARDAIEKKWEQPRPEHGKKTVSVRTSFTDNQVVIEIKDSGTGIPDDILDKIFEPFFTTKKTGKGTGLGLSISYGIILDYEGTIDVETKQGIGTNFIIRFPSAKET